ncbi:MAG TPA: methylated-DNA--[protein]-cysteine S-methyltransferase [Opitutaceae bacterium]|nr:methylated-DNA--[protein]-cysteine S-methyltransferase [Opitutaceae bacterium]
MPRITFSTAFGRCALVWGNAGVAGFELPEAEARTDDTGEAPAWIGTLADRVQRHLAGEWQDFSDVRYDFDQVTAFQRRVYRAALAVKAGHTCTYGELAAALGLESGASRAVGHALGANPWPLLVPCHRFVGAKGKMTGFSAPGGVRTKTRLLALEGAQLLAEQ